LEAGKYSAVMSTRPVKILTNKILRKTSHISALSKKAPEADMKSAIALALLCKTPAFTACVPDESSLY